MAEDYALASTLLGLIERVDAGHSLRLADLREELGINYDCARSYMTWIQKHRDLVVERDGKSKVWRLRPESDPRPEAIYEAAALSFAVDALTELSGSPHYDALTSAAERARLSLPPGAQTQLDRVTRNFQVRSGERPLGRQRDTILRELMRAIHERRPCWMRYQPAGKPEKVYNVRPWGLVLHKGRLLFSAGKEPEKGVKAERRFFTVDGVRELKVHDDERFEEPSNRHTDWSAIFEDSFGIFCDWPGGPEDVHLLVQGRNAVLLRQRALHPSQQTHERGDWLEVRLRVALCPELKSWVRAMIPNVQVLGPSSLMDELKAEVAQWLELDRSDSDL